MSWWLVLLFWNPAIQDFDVADGWYPMPYATYQICDMRLQYVENYLPAMAPDKEHIVDCIQAVDRETAIAIANQDGDPV